MIYNNKLFVFNCLAYIISPTAIDLYIVLVINLQTGTVSSRIEMSRLAFLVTNDTYQVLTSVTDTHETTLNLTQKILSI